MVIKKICKLQVSRDDIPQKTIDAENIEIEKSDLDSLLKIANKNLTPCPSQEIHVFEWEIESEKDIREFFTPGKGFSIQLYCWMTIVGDKGPEDIPEILVINHAYYIPAPNFGYYKDCKAIFRIFGASRVGLVPMEET